MSIFDPSHLNKNYESNKKPLTKEEIEKYNTNNLKKNLSVLDGKLDEKELNDLIPKTDLEKPKENKIADYYKLNIKPGEFIDSYWIKSPENEKSIKENIDYSIEEGRWSERRNVYAGQIMAAMMSKGDNYPPLIIRKRSKQAIYAADCLIEELKKTKE